MTGTPLFILLKINQLIFIIITLISCFTSSQVKRNIYQHSGEVYSRQIPSWTRFYDVYNSQSLLSQNDKSFTVDDFDFAFKIIHCAIGLSFCTAVVTLVTSIAECCGKNIIEVQLFLYGLLVSFWIPFTFYFFYMVTVQWHENNILSQYHRPQSWIVALGSSISLTWLLVLDLILFFVAHHRKSDSPDTDTAKKITKLNQRNPLDAQIKPHEFRARDDDDERSEF